MYSTLSKELPSTHLDAGAAVIAAIVVGLASSLEGLASTGTTSAAPPPPAAPTPPATHLPKARQFFACDAVPILRTPTCGYYNASAAMKAPVWHHLHPSYPSTCDRYDLIACDANVFDGALWTSWSAQNWQYPLYSVLIYLVLIPIIKAIMADRQPIKIPYITALWNFALSAFSIAGAYYTVPHLLFSSEMGLLTRGFYASTCVHASSFGCGYLGFFVALFIYSKFAELVDTLLLLLRKAPVIPLHWYHHATVLLYCWHSYAARIGTGLWYAAMNYSVHAIMYFYFGLTQCGPTAKRYAKRVSMLITLLQLSQMVVGITVTVSSLVYHARGDVCYVPAANSVMGLTMYASYFALFFVLFKSLYLTKKEKQAKAEREESRAKSSKAGAGAGAAAKKAGNGGNGDKDARFEGWPRTPCETAEIEMVVSTGEEVTNMVCSGREPVE